MSYYAQGSGSVTAKDETAYKNLTAIIDNDDNLQFETFPDDKDLTIGLDSDGNYHDDLVYAFIKSIAPFIKSGNIEYTGEDGTHWQFRFDPNKNEWIEENGKTVYDMSTFSDDELIEELKNRGYTVTKSTATRSE